jgi:hypothetical protein
MTPFRSSGVVSGRLFKAPEEAAASLQPAITGQCCSVGRIAHGRTDVLRMHERRFDGHIVNRI